MTNLIISVVALILIGLVSGISFYILIREEDKTERKFTRKYAIVYILVIWLLGILSLVNITNIPTAYVLFQIGFFVLGGLHVFLLYAMHRWNDNGHEFLKEFLYTLFVFSLGTAGFVAIFYLLKPLAAKISVLDRVIPTGLETRTVFNTTTILFVLPLVLVHGYLFWRAIPRKIYKQLKYKANATDHSHYDRRHIRQKLQVQFLISLEEMGTDRLIPVVATVDQNYQFGGFFHVLVDEYNRKNPRTPIINLDTDHGGEPVSWLFYRKPRFWIIGKRYIDPYTTFFKNQINSGDTIVALRVAGEPEPEQIEDLPAGTRINVSPSQSKITIKNIKRK